MDLENWKKPNGKLNIWKKLKLVEKLNNCENKEIDVSIQDVPNDRYEDVIKLMLSDFIVDEPMCKCLNIANDKQVEDDFRKIWDFCLSHGITVGAFKIGDNNELLELIGCNILLLSNELFDKQAEDIVAAFKSDISKRIFSAVGNVTKESEPEFHKICSKGPYISALGLCVKRQFRGQKLGVELLKSRDNIGKKYNIKSTSTAFTATASQKQALRAGFTTVLEKEYDNIRDESGSLAFPGITEKIMCIMAKNLEN